MGRFVAFALLVVLFVPAFLLWRQWRAASGRRLINEGTLAFVDPTPEAEATWTRWPQRARLLLGLGAALGLVGIVVLAVHYGTLSVFLWPPVFGAGLLVGVLLGELLRPRPRWRTSPGKATSLSDHMEPQLLWWLRGAGTLAVLAGAAIVARSQSTPQGRVLSCLTGQGTLEPALVVAAVSVGVASLLIWTAAEATVRSVRTRPGPVEFDDVPLDQTLRSARGHAAVASATALVLVPLGLVAAVVGISSVEGCAGGDLVGTGLVAGGLAAVLAGLSVAAFVPSWVRTVQRTVDAHS